MDGKSLARVVAVIFVAIAVTATAVEMNRKEEKSVTAVTGMPRAALSLTTLREGLRRCQTLGGAALRDGDCLRLWAEQRDRFLGSKSPFATSASGPVTAPKDATSSEAR
ncbi:MAG: conjugal transfer protein TrbK [Mesorhizobium sp.]|nr:conjugal transfer protein TrbK [bacterium M00.F.Ca.ET.205.01.1.1]TGU49410.1 conjugal transfer protein TrbK [bacterium M00.F.Ca.ET.152.01.1.1]TGV33508.1 conjugal transfer protein TrbK [Mesorhizobium sp. M00.F.Ca.ET.186.01.1.1]TGZ40412.1 conjugal transfer protein TrbK [bacterium M00.F.Ca.ET.162.01.1.1]TIW63151.1 MAG: conjugal transfer protein TrbK [Mesorhizobium sp.]